MNRKRRLATGTSRPRGLLPAPGFLHTALPELASLPSKLSGGGQTYLRESRRPLVSLAFIVPILATYEAGVLLLGADTVRNGADVWLRGFLDNLGFSHYFLLPVLTVALLLAWHHVSRERWQVSAIVLYGMVLECVLLAGALLAAAEMQGNLVAAWSYDAHPAAPLAIVWSKMSFLGRLVGFFGAGIYEEVLFRLMLLPAVAGLLGAMLGGPKLARVAAVVITSAVFALAHYVGPQGETFEWFSFAFRAMAGGFFCVLFTLRGFGIAAGTHALYDILAGLA